MDSGAVAFRCGERRSYCNYFWFIQLLEEQEPCLG